MHMDFILNLNHMRFLKVNKETHFVIFGMFVFRDYDFDKKPC